MSISINVLDDMCSGTKVTKCNILTDPSVAASNVREAAGPTAFTDRPTLSWNLGLSVTQCLTWQKCKACPPQNTRQYKNNKDKTSENMNNK